jgi:hypothetical protein
VALPDECPICHAELVTVNAPGPEGRPERVECTGGNQHTWLVVDQGTPEDPEYRLGEPLD